MSEKCPKLLELRLGLPGDEDDDRWFAKHVLNNKNTSFRDTNDSLLSLNMSSNNNHNINSPWSHQQPNSALTINHGLSKESSQNCSTSLVVDLQKAVERKKDSANTAHLPNNPQKRFAPAPVVGWPPIRSFRKSLVSTSTKRPLLETLDAIPCKTKNEKSDGKNKKKGLFVKINMDGVPIGRKVDLNAYNTYAHLSSAVDQLFKDLLAAQRDSCEEKVIRGILDGSGEYTLVYEDNEGDRMLVGDVPWHMFVATVRRLRVLKSSDLPTLTREEKSTMKKTNSFVGTTMGKEQSCVLGVDT